MEGLRGGPTAPHRTVKCVPGLTCLLSHPPRKPTEVCMLWNGDWVGRLSRMCSDLLTQAERTDVSMKDRCLEGYMTDVQIQTQTGATGCSTWQQPER